MIRKEELSRSCLEILSYPLDQNQLSGSWHESPSTKIPSETLGNSDYFGKIAKHILRVLLQALPEKYSVSFENSEINQTIKREINHSATRLLGNKTALEAGGNGQFVLFGIENKA